MSLYKDRLPSIDRHVTLVADGQRPKPPRDLSWDGGPFGLVHGEAQAGLEGVVEEAHVRAVVAVALLHSKRVEDPIAAWRDAGLTARGHQPIPYLPGPGRVGIKLPAQLADVGHALGQHRNAGEADLARLHERKPTIRHIVIGHAFEHLTRLWPPHADHRKVLG